MKRRRDRRGIDVRSAWRRRRRAEVVAAHRATLDVELFRALLFGEPPPDRDRLLQGIRAHMPMRQCLGCGVPVVTDAFGNTDHVCLTLHPRQQAVLDALLDNVRSGRGRTRVVLETTAQGSVHDWFWRRWHERRAHEAVFLPWFHDETKEVDHVDD